MAKWSGNASNQGEGQDDFVFHISKDEYLDILFDDLKCQIPSNRIQSNRRI